MTASRHTPGPWSPIVKPVDGWPEDGFLTECYIGIPPGPANGHNAKYAAEVFTWGADFTRDPEALANARLDGEG